MANNTHSDGCVDLCPPVRNRYFYGKLLDVFHFELEQDYFNTKRWLLNRLVAGYGVVCGLGVQLGPDKQSVIVLPGVAIDECGHEIIVCQPSEPVDLRDPPAQAPASPPPSNSAAAGSAPAANPASSPTGTDCCDAGKYVHVSICYHECQTDPVPAMGGDCDTEALCSPGAIRERYRIEKGDGKLCPATTISRIQDVISNGLINYSALANYITNPCLKPPDDCCIPLANVRIPDAGQIDPSNIDITIRPIVYTNDVLYQLILAWMSQGQPQARGGKP